MRIAQIAPLWEPVPPRTYGGSELVVHLLTEELVRLGHEVTLFASGDSVTQARLISTIPRSLRGDAVQMPFFQELRLLEKVFAQSEQFDVIHNHLGPTALPFASLTSVPVVTTLHNALKYKNLQDFFKNYAHLPYVSISHYQQTLCQKLNYISNVYHGINIKQFTPSLTVGDKKYLAFLGRFSAEKGPHHAIRVAKETGWPLIMAGKVEVMDKDFFKEEIEPQIDGQQIQFIGEVDHLQKVELLRNAAATLFPVTWPEPFGLVLVESLACGTPVLALRDGSIPEILRPGITGFIGESIEDLIEYAGRIGEIDRRVCHYDAAHRFAMERMAQDYLEVYNIIAKAPKVLLGAAASRTAKASLSQKGNQTAAQNKPFVLP